jgi:stearoyl-CoA desaturase (delta-9 desaturase)
VALITNGEGYHNFHHRFASDYRNGVRWYQWDPTKWSIAIMSWCGLARKLYRTPQHAILAAKVAAEHQRIERALSRQRVTESPRLLELVRERYTQFKTTLYEWEHWEKEYRRIRATVSEASQTSLRTLKEQVAAKRLACLEARRVWVALLSSRPLLARAAQV